MPLQRACETQMEISNRREERMLKRILSWVGIALFLSASMGFAQVPGNPDGTPHPDAQRAVAPQAARPKPFTSFTARGSGTSAAAETLTPCAGVACTAGDACACLTIRGVTRTTQGLGKSKLTARITLDASPAMTTVRAPASVSASPSAVADRSPEVGSRTEKPE